jgi:hypothetical protein
MNEQPVRSSRQLLISTALAAAVAASILVTVVLPAEYGVDPLRTGRLLGLSAMSASKGAAAAGKPARADTSLMHEHPQKHRSARIEIQVNGHEELEYKALLAAGEPLLYSWTVAGGEVYCEFHGEPTEGNWPKDFYQSYQIVERTGSAYGSFVAPFTGQHGWYWRNLSSDPVTIVLETSGYYTKLGRIGGGRIQ